MPDHFAYVEPSRAQTLWDRIDESTVTEVLVLVAWFAIYLAVVGAVAWFTASMVSLSIRIAHGTSLTAGFQTPLHFYEPGPPSSASEFAGFCAGLFVALLFVVRTIWTMLSRRALFSRLRATPSSASPAADRALLTASIAAGYAVRPPLLRVPCAGANALLVGTSRQSVAVAVTSELEKALTEEGMTAVFACLLSRVDFGRTRALNVLVALFDPAFLVRRIAERVGGLALGGPAAKSVITALALAYAVLLFVVPQFVMLAVWTLVVLAVAWVLTTLASLVYYRASVRSGELGDAEGMMLLKDPRLMLETVHKVLTLDDEVPGGVAFAPFFYCWPGSPYLGSEFSEMARVERLREVLGPSAATVQVGRTTE